MIITMRESKKNLNELISEINNKNCFAFLGAGLSKDAKYPLWHELISEFEGKLGVKKGTFILEAKGDFLLAAERIQKKIGIDEFYNLLFDIFNNVDHLDYTPNHITLLKIPFMSYITTNYDFCLERAAVAIGIEKEFPYYYLPHLPPTSLKDGGVFHIHGIIHPDNPEEYKESIVFTKSEYEKRYHAQSRLSTFLRSIFPFHSVVFIGYGLSDRHLIEILEDIVREAQVISKTELHSKGFELIGPNVFIINHLKIINDEKYLRLIEELDMKPIFYDGDNTHRGLDSLLNEIRDRTCGVETVLVDRRIDQVRSYE